jgi:predicted ATPase
MPAAARAGECGNIELFGMIEHAVVELLRQAFYDLVGEKLGGHPTSVCFTLAYCSSVFLWSGDLQRAGELIEQLTAFAGRYSLAPYSAAGIALKGELAVVRGDAEAGLSLLRCALETLRAKRHNVFTTLCTGALAEGLQKTDRVEEAFLTVNGAIARAIDCGEAIHLAELLRIKAQVLVSAPHNNRSSSMDCLTESLTVARRQSALALELRSATALARLLSESGQRDQARRTLALVYDRFTEGFRTTDLRIARQLIKELA